MGRRRFFASVGILLAAMLLAAPAAQAIFHLMKIREVHTGGASGGSYVELQMHTDGQNFVAGHKVVVYGAGGASVHTFTFPSNVGSGANQATILVAGSGYAAAFPSGPAPDASDASLDLPAGAGAVCFESIDCLSWGSFDWGANPQPSPTGTPAAPAGVAAGKALRRSIEPGCPTLLDLADDTDDSATDFAEREPNPRSNASPIVETKCVAPDTTVTAEPANPTNSTDASFEFTATPPDEATFECRLDAALSFTACTSPKDYSGLAEGLHTFRVRAVHPTNGTDGTPAVYSWTIDLTLPIAEITEAPADHSPGGSASFKYKSNEDPGADFECSLAREGEVDNFLACPPTGETYNELDDLIVYVFKVRATDKAGNQGEPDEHEWTVDNSAADTTPPETTIILKPPNPSTSSTAIFTYASNEPGSSFECKLDGAAFAGCPAAGIAYTGLADGSHTFQVRARDPSGNLDESPAGCTFDVVLAIASPGPLPPLPPPPPAEPELGTAFAAADAQVRGVLALLRMGCRGRQGARCDGALRLVAPLGTARSSRRMARNLTIGKTRYSLPPGSGLRTVRVRLTPQGRGLVRRAGQRGLRVNLVGRGLKGRVLVLRDAGRGSRASR